MKPRKVRLNRDGIPTIKSEEGVTLVDEMEAIEFKRKKTEAETMTDFHKTPDGHVCVICRGVFPFLGKDCYGLRLNRNQHYLKDVPDFFICWECVHWIFKRFSEQLSGLSYTLLSSSNEEAEDTQT